IGQDRPQGPGTDQLGDGARIARVGLALAAGEALSGPVDGDARHVDEAQPLGQEDGLQEAGQRSGDVEPDHDVATEAAQVRDEALDRCLVVVDSAVEQNPRGWIESTGPVGLLGDVYSNVNLHGGPRMAWR